jgi:hypothetical protein
MKEASIMSVGELAGLLAAIALCVLVALAAVPLLKAGRALDELRLTVRDLGHSSVPVLVELKSAVENTNDELVKLSAVTEDVARVSANATVVSQQAANLSQLFATTLGGPLVRTAAVAHGIRSALKGRQRKGRSK